MVEFRHGFCAPLEQEEQLSALSICNVTNRVLCVIRRYNLRTRDDHNQTVVQFSMGRCGDGFQGDLQRQNEEKMES